MSPPVAIEVRDVSKTFRIPTNRIVTLKQRVLQPFEGQQYRTLRALDDVSIDVHRGEFFGIVGRNGSGKSTLLKLISSIYRADVGSIRVAGRMAPFIELGVGFNPELSAYDNVVLNGVMMGLTPREARRRFDAVIEFAELEEFTELKLRNYSSGMRVRLAFAVMVQVDADVMLIDEVLAVGDAAFQERCSETFMRLIQRGKTIVLVTHSMGTLGQYCDRAMLLEAGQVDIVGNPEEVAARYTEINFARHAERRRLRKPGDPSVARPDQRRRAVVHDAWIEDASGERTVALDRREPIELRAEVELLEDLGSALVGLEIWAASGHRLFASLATEFSPHNLHAGARLRVAVTIENRFAPGHYRLNYGLATRGLDGVPFPISDIRGIVFEVSGERVPGLLLDLEHEGRIEAIAHAEVVKG